MRNLTPAAAELNFLERACKLETYGIEPHAVKDHKKNQLFVGFNHYGILAFQGNKKVYNFKWNELQKITYEGKMFIVHHLVNGVCSVHKSCVNHSFSFIEKELDWFQVLQRDCVPEHVEMRNRTKILLHDELIERHS